MMTLLEPSIVLLSLGISCYFAWLSYSLSRRYRKLIHAASERIARLQVTLETSESRLDEKSLAIHARRINQNLQDLFGPDGRIVPCLLQKEDKGYGAFNKVLVFLITEHLTLRDKGICKIK